MAIESSPMSSGKRAQKCQTLRRELDRLARQMIFGTLSERYHTCGHPGCRCRHEGPKHGPHLQVSYRGPSGKTTGYAVPQALAASVRGGVAAWHQFLAVARELADLNRDALWRPEPRRARR